MCEQYNIGCETYDQHFSHAKVGRCFLPLLVGVLTRTMDTRAMPSVSSRVKKKQSHIAERVRVQARFDVVTKYYITTLISA